MNIEKAIEIISNNYYGKEGSLVCSLYNDCDFSIEKFWEFYDSIEKIVTSMYYNNELTMQISISYQRILKEFIFHLSPNDVSDIYNFPENYCAYIERLDFAVLAYYTQNPDLLSNEGFELER